MVLRPITDGAVAGTNLAIPVPTSRVLGAVAITADGTNNATVLIKRENASGFALFHIVTKQPLWIPCNVDLQGVTTMDVSVSGTGAMAQLFEAVA
jgi:hypothetical protein